MSADRDARIADYVLGLTEGEEAAAFEREMARDPALAREVAAGQERLHALDASAPPFTAGEGLWSRVERAIDGPSPRSVARPSLASSSGGLWSSLTFWRSFGLATAAASLALAIGLGAPLVAGWPAPRFVAILVPEDGSAAGAIVEVSADGAARLIALQDIPVPEGRALEVWTLPDPATGPVSVGLLGKAASLDLAVGALPPTGDAQLFEITLEPAAGSPIGQPTGPILFKGLTIETL